MAESRINELKSKSVFDINVLNTKPPVIAEGFSIQKQRLGKNLMKSLVIPSLYHNYLIFSKKKGKLCHMKVT